MVSGEDAQLSSSLAQSGAQNAGINITAAGLLSAGGENSNPPGSQAQNMSAEPRNEIYEDIFQLDGQLLSIWLFIISSVIYLVVLLSERQRAKEIEAVKAEPAGEQKKAHRESLKQKWAWLPFALQVAAIMVLLASLWFLGSSTEALDDPSLTNTPTARLIFIINLLAAISGVMRTAVVFLDPSDDPEEINTLVPL